MKAGAPGPPFKNLYVHPTAKSQLRFERGQKAGTSRKKGTANDIG